MTKVKRMVLLAVMVAQALILSIVESGLQMPVPVPGVKLGLANIVLLTVILFFSWSDALLVMFVRCALSSIYSGGLTFFFFSAAGGLLSTLVMALLHRRFSKSFSVVGISIAGAVAHNTGQLLVAAVLMGESSLMAYMPVLLVSGVVTGCFVGLCVSFLANALRKTRLFSSK